MSHHVNDARTYGSGVGVSVPQWSMVPPNLAPDWIAAWNSHDLDRVLAFYTDDFEMSSPHIVNLVGESSGTLSGKLSIRAYWEKAMKLFPGLHFKFETVYVGANSVVICYTNQAGRRCGEILFFNSEGKCFRSAAHHASESAVV